MVFPRCLTYPTHGSLSMSSYVRMQSQRMCSASLVIHQELETIRNCHQRTLIFTRNHHLPSSRDITFYFRYHNFLVHPLPSSFGVLAFVYNKSFSSCLSNTTDASASYAGVFSDKHLYATSSRSIKGPCAQEEYAEFDSDRL